jgi:hypothetical protein
VKQMTSDRPEINFNQLFKLRLVVARYGEMDLARWWNTREVLGRRGTVLFKRGFPTTHHFAQARAAFAVARSRCNELFSPPGCMTLWNPPPDVEEQFEECWQSWLDEALTWCPFFDELANLQVENLLQELSRLQLVNQSQVAAVSKLHRSAEGRAVPLPGTHVINDEVLTLLAAGFALGEPGSPSIPYARLAE